MEVLFGTHEAFHRHNTGPLHPERPARLRAVAQGVEQSGLAVRPLKPEPASLELLTKVHSLAYIEAMERFCRSGGGHLDADTLAGPDSWEAALLAAGAGPGAATALNGHSAQTAFLAVRPPGHHALTERAMGFCLFNNVAVTAAWLRDRGERVAILDWDVHHGNGTQSTFYSDPRVLYLSLHQFPFYPYVGDVDELGEGEGTGYNINLPLPAHSSGEVYRYAWLRVVGPVLDQFRPDWLLVSAGYDAHHEDPLAEMRLEAEDYGWLAWSLRAVLSPSRTIYFLEGGYHLPALVSSVAATLKGAAGTEPPLPATFASPADSFLLIDRVAEVAGRHWQL
jgi:acetoin utilization deacetylase AcuC-like enzyme